MKNQTQSDRFRSVLEEQQISVFGLALRLGIAPPDELYAILRSNKKMPVEIAERIHELMPQYSVQWLLDGVQE